MYVFSVTEKRIIFFNLIFLAQVEFPIASPDKNGSGAYAILKPQFI